jgi:hypothetical protein
MEHQLSAEPSTPSSNGPTTVDLQEDTSKHEHKMHPDCPDTLDCLPDTEGRPQHTLPVILRCAILGSPKKRLTIREIYAAMEAKYPYYRTAGPTWKVLSVFLFSNAATLIISRLAICSPPPLPQSPL